ncbi:MAG: dihydrofolate reductase [Flavobacteriales bacterium]|nr:dihydrofolate reductase [Flavobacteriales bacterium]
MQPVCSVFCGVSLDGFIARLDGTLDFLEGDGTADMADHGYEAFIGGIDAIVMGRHTFEVVLGFGQWPYAKKVFVLSTGNADLSVARQRGADVELLNATPEVVMHQLAARGYKHLYIDGGGTVQRFLRSGLINRLIITHVPVLIGQGIPLFGQLEKDIRWKLVASRSFPGGLVQSEYAR